MTVGSLSIALVSHIGALDIMRSLNVICLTSMATNCYTDIAGILLSSLKYFAIKCYLMGLKPYRF